MIVNVIKIVILIKMFAGLAKSSFLDISENRLKFMKDINDTGFKAYPNLLVQQKEKEGVSGFFCCIFNFSKNHR